ncbi:glycosyltransferase family 2 protein [Tabrizicola sp.]|uniref:glycosyltransferase family 2 protein n=1 Tax=Tabrizicola sp. TaxID=2005166 RepID=UPI002FDC9F86
MTSHSIIILTKDRPGLLPRAVASAMRALGDDGEVLVVDDASKRPAEDVLHGPGDQRLRIMRREFSAGISAARNAGIAASRGAVIFFLDDDDELWPDYIGDILHGPAPRFDYGFSACVVTRDGRREPPRRPRFATGPVPRNAPLRKQLCGTGMGFWIHRQVADAVGPFTTEIPINEDTDYVCRLIEQGRRAWYSARPGVTVHSHASANEAGNITTRLDALQRAQAMLHVCDRFPAMAGHLGRSYLRHCARAGLFEESARYLSRQTDRRLRIQLTMYFHLKCLGYRARGLARRKA